MGFAVLAGLASLTQMPLKLYPDVDVPIIVVTVEYLGAAPEEVESGVCTRLEEQLEGLEGIKELRSTAAEGICTVQDRSTSAGTRRSADHHPRIWPATRGSPDQRRGAGRQGGANAHGDACRPGVGHLPSRNSAGRCGRRSTAKRCSGSSVGPDDVRIMVRYGESARRSLDSLYALRARTPAGGEVPFATVADARLSPAVPPNTWTLCSSAFHEPMRWTACDRGGCFADRSA